LSTKGKLKELQENELELSEKISMKKANDELLKTIKEKEESLTRLKVIQHGNNYECSESIKQKLLDFIELQKEHSNCSQKINMLETRLNGIQSKTYYDNNIQIVNKSTKLAKDSTQDECGSQTSNDVIHINERDFNVNSNKLKVNLKVPEFHGNEEENISNWIYIMESIFSISQNKR